MKSLRARVVLGFAMVVVIAAAVFVPRVLRQMAFFRVRQVEVVGARYLDERDVARRLGLRAGASTFDRLEPIRRAAAAIPGVIAASVERRLPGTIRVTVRELAPVALADAPDHLVLLDSLGRVLPFDPSRAPRSLPIVERNAGIAGLLARIRASDPLLYDKVDAARLDHGDVILDMGTRRVRLRPEAGDDVLRAVVAVMANLEQSATAWREIDARYRSRVFVQKGAA